MLSFHLAGICRSLGGPGVFRWRVVQHRVVYSQKAATKQALVAQATIHTTFHCLAEAGGIHPGRGREGAAGRGAASPPSGKGFKSQSNSQSLHQEFTLLGGPMSGQASSWLGGTGPPKHGCMLSCPHKRKLLGTHCLPGLGWSHLLPGKMLSAYHVPAL